MVEIDQDFVRRYPELACFEDDSTRGRVAVDALLDRVFAERDKLSVFVSNPIEVIQSPARVRHAFEELLLA